MKSSVDPKVAAARSAHEEAKRQLAEAAAACSAALAVFTAAQGALATARAQEQATGVRLDDVLNPPTCEMGIPGLNNWRRVVIARRTISSVWVRERGQPSGAETRFVQVDGEWTRYGKSDSWLVTKLRGVP